MCGAFQYYGSNTPPAGITGRSRRREFVTQNASFQSIGFQWEKFESWRAHPLLKFRRRNPLPGFFIGLTAFAVYVV